MSFAAALALIIAASSHAQVKALDPDDVLKAARQHIQKGEGCLSSGDGPCARREFDSAVDEFLQSGLDLRSDQRLLAGWREMIERISRYETTPVAAGGKVFWSSQEFEGRPTEERVADARSEPAGPLGPDAFQIKFAELKKLFHDKYDREITLTGADHAEHRRLYGRGSAYDIRVRDLTREQVHFIIATGKGLGLRIKDFSTWESVAAHNARTYLLGRPLDTLATGVHLHIDRMAFSQKKNLIAVPTVSSKPAKRTGKR